MPLKIAGKLLAEFFFKAEAKEDDNGNPYKLWHCNRCSRAYKSYRGYSNLTAHLGSCIGNDFEKQFESHIKDSGHTLKDGKLVGAKQITQKTIDTFAFSNDKEMRAYTWIKWIACRNMPLSEIENPITRSLSKYKAFSIKTIRRYIIATAQLVESAIAEELKAAGVITLLFDGWTADGTSTHYVAVFAGYQHPVTTEYNEVLLAISPTLEETELGAAAHIELFESTMALYNLTKDNIICVIGDNCSANQSISRRWEIPLVGCASHRFNLAVKRWISEQPGLEDALEAVNTLMSKASCLKAAAELRSLTLEFHGKALAAQSNNVTRWTSTFTMVKRYMRIKDQLETVHSLGDYCLSPAQNRKIVAAVVHFEVFHSISTELQAKDLDLEHCRLQFDTLLDVDSYSESMADYIAPTGRIVASPLFESGVVKLIQGERLSDGEAEACKKLKKTLPTENTGNGNRQTSAVAPVTIQDRLELNRNKRRKTLAHGSGDYLQVEKIVCATSNCCERLFSEAAYIMVPHRRGISPVLFEALLYLKKNLPYWSINTVAQAMRMKEEDIRGLATDDDMHYDE